MGEKTIPRGTERCIRRATTELFMAPADISEELDERIFRRRIGYGPRDQEDDAPEPGMTTYRLGCAVTDCTCTISITRVSGQTQPTAIQAANMETCRRT